MSPRLHSAHPPVQGAPVSGQALSERLGLPSAGLWVLAAIALTLAAAATFRGLAERRRPDQETARAWKSVGTWWVLFGLLVVVLAAGRAGVLLAMGVASLLLLRETLRLVGSEKLLPFGVALACGLYAWAWLDPPTLFLRVLPTTIGLLAAFEVGLRLGFRSLFTTPPRLQYPASIALIGPSYAFGLATLAPPAHAPGSELGWFLLLVVITELNDMAQSWWGRAIGSRRLAPVLSPGKTWEGLLGGLATSTLAAVVLCPTLTSWGRAHPPGLDLPLPPWIWSVAVGLAIGLAGVSGDLTASALKRDAGVKDSGTLLPGHGGLLDRLDSLAATAPVFFALTYLLWSPIP